MNDTKKKKTLEGKVISDKMNLTVTVGIERTLQHPVFGKIIKRTSKVYAHNEGNMACNGDLVLVEESRPLSKLKRWRVVEIIKKANVR